jgi:hypothetical protein
MLLPIHKLQTAMLKIILRKHLTLTRRADKKGFTEANNVAAKLLSKV